MNLRLSSLLSFFTLFYTSHIRFSVYISDILPKIMSTRTVWIPSVINKSRYAMFQVEFNTKSRISGILHWELKFLIQCFSHPFPVDISVNARLFKRYKSKIKTCEYKPLSDEEKFGRVFLYSPSPDLLFTSANLTLPAFFIRTVHLSNSCTFQSLFCFNVLFFFVADCCSCCCRRRCYYCLF